MSTTLVMIEERDGELSRASQGALTLARSAAPGTDLAAVAIGAPTDGTRSQLALQGVAAVHQLEGDGFDDRVAPAQVAEALVRIQRDLGADVVVAPASDLGSETMAHAGAMLGVVLAANCIAATPADGGLDLTRVRWGGVLLEDAHLSAHPALVTSHPHLAPVEDAGAVGDAGRTTVTTPADPEHAAGRVLEREALSDGVSLATARVVVAGGRGMGSGEAFAPLEELAGLLGGAVGCSRVATNNGWRSHNDQVGQTGTRVAPDLYIACGISGATQHWVGCMSSKRILALNMDAEAPLVTYSDYAVIGDLHAVLPPLIDAIKQRKGVAA